jgi:hypothetical protein
MTIVWQTGWTRVFARPAGFWMMTQEYVPGSKLLRIRTLRQKYPTPLNATLTTSTSAAVAGAGGKVGNAGGERLGVFQGSLGTVFPRVIACARSANSPRDVLRPAPCCTPRAISPSESVSLLQRVKKLAVPELIAQPAVEALTLFVRAPTRRLRSPTSSCPAFL